MFGWIKKRVLNASTGSKRNDMERFISGLKGADSNELAMLLVLGNSTRLRLIEQDLIPPGALDYSIPRVGDIGIKCDMCPIQINGYIKQAEKQETQSLAAACMIWLHSVRALNDPELRFLGQEMWDELSRGFPNIEDAFDDLDGAAPELLHPHTFDELHFIPPGLEPWS